MFSYNDHTKASSFFGDNHFVGFLCYIVRLVQHLQHFEKFDFPTSFFSNSFPSLLLKKPSWHWVKVWYLKSYFCFHLGVYSCQEETYRLVPFLHSFNSTCYLLNNVTCALLRLRVATTFELTSCNTLRLLILLDVAHVKYLWFQRF